MDLSLFNNTANKVAPSDVSNTSPSRSDVQPSTQPNQEKFSSLLSSPQQTRTRAPVVQNTARPQTITPSVTSESFVAPTETVSPELQQAAMEQGLFGAMGVTDNSGAMGLMQNPATSLGDALQAGLDPTLLQAQAVTSKQAVGVPVKIQAILDFILKSDGLAETAPVLASLKAQAKTPLLDLTSIVEESPFFKELELSNNPEELLKKAMPVAQLLSQLQVSPKILLALDAAGFDLRDKASPEQILKALGISPQKLDQALNNLAMNRNDAPPQEIIMPVQHESAQKNKQVVETETHAASPRQPVATEAPAQTQQAQPPVQVAKTPTVKAAANDPFETMGLRMTENNTTKMTFQTNDDTTVANSTEQSPELTVSSSQFTSQEKIPVLATEGTNPTPNESVATPSVVAPREETIDALLRRQFLSNEDASQPAPQAEAPVEMEAVAPVMPTETKPTTTQPSVSVLSPEQIAAAQELPISQSEGSWENKKDSFSSENDDLPLEKEEEISSLDAKRPELSLHDTMQNKNNRVEHKSEAAPKEPMNETHFAERAKEIFDKAEMLVKDGGGSMQIDMSSKELGKLDLSVNVQADKVDLRIIASSENVKEILTQEIPKLREALNNQNLQLKNVEVSYQSMGGWNSNSQAQQRSFDLQNSKSDSPAARRIDSMRAFAARPRSYANPIQHSGQIQVLV